MSYRVISLSTFDKQVSKRFSRIEKIQLNLFIRELKQFEGKTGKILTYRFFREKKLKEKRVYYLIYDDISLILLVAISDKKNQQDVIDEIKSNLSSYKKYIYEKFI